MNKAIIDKYKGYGFKIVKKISNKNKRFGASYWLLSKNNEEYLLKIKEETSSKDFVFDENLSVIFSEFGYPSVYKVEYAEKKVIELTSFLRGKVILPKAYTLVNEDYFRFIQIFFDKYQKTVSDNISSDIGYYKNLDSKYFLNKISVYKAEIVDFFKDSLDDIFISIESELVKNSKEFDKCMSVQHGDCYASNMIINEKGQVMLIDWESVKYAPIYFDFATFFAKQILDEKLIMDLYQRQIQKVEENSRIILLNISIVLALLKQLKNICSLDKETFESELFQRQSRLIFKYLINFSKQSLSKKIIL